MRVGCGISGEKASEGWGKPMIIGMSCEDLRVCSSRHHLTSAWQYQMMWWSCEIIWRNYG